MPRGDNPNSRKNLVKNSDLTPEQRKEKARAAGSAPKRRRAKTMRQLAAVIANAPIKNTNWRQHVEELGITDEADLVHNAVVVASVFHAAIEGDLRAVEKWESYLAPKERKHKAPGQGGARDPLSQSLMELAGGLTSDPVPGVPTEAGEGGDHAD